MSYVWWIVSTIVIFLLTRLYHFRQKPKNPLKAGVTLGLLLATITFLIEIPLIVYGFGIGWKIYLFWMTWIHYSLVILSSITAALTK